MTPLDALKAQLSVGVPFAAHVGIAISEVGEGSATAALEQTQSTSNHVATMHAGALFTLAEAASGAAMAGMFLERLAGVRPVAASAAIDFLKPARGTIRAAAQVQGTKAALFAVLDEAGKVRFPVNIAILDEKDREVGRMVVEWHLTALSAAA